MEWPSKNVPPGGIFHTKKVNYSNETAKFLKELLDESKLSIRQKQRFENILRNNDVKLGRPPRKTKDLASNTDITIRPGSPKRRSIQTIINSGAYEREKFVPIHPVKDREKEKEKLQEIMAYNQVVQPKKKWPKFDVEEPIPEVPPTNRYDQLEKEIRERQAWLEQMEKLGEGDRFKSIIHQQIQCKLREMERLASSKSTLSTARKN